MDRIILGKAPANNNPYYHRSDKFGLFISKPGANVYQCSDGDLMFDSTAPTFMQTITSGMAIIPKAVYSVGIFGEQGVITENNWNSDVSLSDINPDTCWLYDAFKQIKIEADEMYWNHTAKDLCGTVYHDTEAGYLAEMDTYTTRWQDAGNAKLLSDLQLQYGVDSGSDLSADGVHYGLFQLPFGYQDPKNLIEGDARVPINTDSLIGTGLPRVAPDGRIWSTLYSDATFNILMNLVGIDSDNYVQSVAKDLWRIYDVFPFLDIPDHDLGTDYNFTDSLVDWPPLTSTASFNGNPQRGGRRDVPTILQALSTKQIDVLLDGNDFNASSDYPYFYPAYKSVWTSDNLNNNSNLYDDSGNLRTAYTPTELQADSGMPLPWRAWTTPETGKYTPQQEKAAIVRFSKIIFLLAWTYYKFGKQVNDGLLNHFYERTASAGSIGGDEGSVYLGNIEHVRFVIETTCPSAFTSIEQYNPANNYSYTEYTDGEVDITTGVEAPNGLPVQLWWNPVYNAPQSNMKGSTTNLTFLGIKENRIKTSSKEKRLTSLVPGLPSVQANTYIQDEMLKIKFFQPSVLDDTPVMFTAYKEPAFLAQTVGDDPTGRAPVIPSDFADSFVFNITDINDPLNPGDNYSGRRADDGRYYTVVFPDDFVKDKFTDTDPFKNYRGVDGRINKPLFITLRIPSGVTLSGNSFHNHIQATNLPARNQFLTQGTKYFGPSDSANRRTTEIFAVNDPCVKLNLHTNAITDDALAQMLIRIENNGTMVGAGGWGSYGQMNTPGDKDVDPSEYPGGGGGGGAGYHPILATENPKTDWIGQYTSPPSPIDGVINSESEIASAQAVAENFWDGPDNYVEWGRGGNQAKGIANTYYTGMDYITWKSIGPGKPGTGYLGATLTQITGIMELGRPYSTEQWDTNVHGSVLSENQYARLAGTYIYQSGIPRFNKDGWGNPGTAGTTTSGGAGGGALSVATFGWNQHGTLEMTLGGTAYRIDWDNPANPGYNAGTPSSGSGGSCVYLFANTTKTISGTQVQLINNPNGIMKSGGGGGSGGDGVAGLGGGKLGRPGNYVDDSVIQENDIATTGQFAWNDYSRRGEPGRLVWWNSENVQNNYTIINYSTNATHGSIEGVDYNESIGDEDYVSYLPDARIKSYTYTTSISGQRLWSRKLNSSGDIVYNTIGEKTYEEYVNDAPDIAFIDE